MSLALASRWTLAVGIRLVIGYSVIGISHVGIIDSPTMTLVIRNWTLDIPNPGGIW